MRTDAPRRFLGRDKRVAVSDTTISRSLSTYFLAPLRKYLKSIYIRANQSGKCKIDLYGRKLKAACVDGSVFGGFYGCVLHVLGEANLLLDIEPTTGKGKELPTTRILLQRAFCEYGPGFVDLFLLDGLYKDKKTINLILSNESHVLVKTTETRLNIIVYTHDFHTFLALMLIIFIGWDLLLLFNLEGIRNGHEYVRWTLDFLSELLKIDFCIQYQALS